MAQGRWMEIMAEITSNPFRPLIVIVLAQAGDEPIDEFNIARHVGMLNQQMSGQPVETAVIVKQIRDLEEGGYVELAADQFRWQLTDLGRLVSRQWVPGNVEPEDIGPLDHAAVRAWRDRVIALLEQDAETADANEVERTEWMLTQTPRLVEMHVLNRVLGEDAVPNWLQHFDAAPGSPPPDMPAD